MTQSSLLKESAANKPSYKEPWFWAVFAPLILVAVVCGFLVSFAFIGADDQVYDDYYKEGRMINNRFDAELAAETLGVGGDLRFDMQSLEVMAQLDMPEYPAELVLQVLHPSKAEQDLDLVLTHVGKNLYRADLPYSLTQRRYILLSSIAEPIWRISSEINFAKEHEIKLKAGLTSSSGS